MTPEAFLKLVEKNHSHNPGFVNAMKKIMAGDCDEPVQGFNEFVKDLVARADSSGQLPGLTGPRGSRAGSGRQTTQPRK